MLQFIILCSQHVLYINAIVILLEKWNCFQRFGKISQHWISSTVESPTHVRPSNLPLIPEVFVALSVSLLSCTWSDFVFLFFFKTSYNKLDMLPMQKKNKKERFLVFFLIFFHLGRMSLLA
jgi:hypothetical protein